MKLLLFKKSKKQNLKGFEERENSFNGLNVLEKHQLKHIKGGTEGGEDSDEDDQIIDL